jgi:hypothetical protein
MSYSLHAYELLTGLRKAILPARFSYTTRLEEVNGLEAFVPTHVQLSESAPNPSVLSLANTAIYVVRNVPGPNPSTIPWGGVLWGKTETSNGAESRLAAKGFMSLYDDGPHGPRRAVRSGAGMSFATNQALQNDGSRAPADPTLVEWDAVDQFDIVRDLFAHCATMAGDIAPTVRAHNVLAGTTRSGVTRNLTVKTTERRGILAIVKQLAALDDGFDWTETIEWNIAGTGAPTPALFLDLWYPHFGEQQGPWIEGRNFTMTADSYSEDATPLALAGAVSFSQNNGQSAAAPDDVRIGVTYPRLEFWEQTDATDPAVIQAEATAAGRALADPVVAISLDVTDVGSSAFDEWAVGDSVFLARNRARGATGPALNDFYRITDVTVSVDADSSGDVGHGRRGTQPLSAAKAKVSVVNEAASLVDTVRQIGS